MPFLQRGEKSDQTLTQHHLKDIETAFHRAKRYLDKSEIEAGEKLLELVKKHATGKNVREVLAMLNNESLEKQVRKIIEDVPFIKPVDHGSCCK